MLEKYFIIFHLILHRIFIEISMANIINKLKNIMIHMVILSLQTDDTRNIDLTSTVLHRKFKGKASTFGCGAFLSSVDT